MHVSVSDIKIMAINYSKYYYKCFVNAIKFMIVFFLLKCIIKVSEYCKVGPKMLTDSFDFNEK